MERTSAYRWWVLASVVAVNVIVTGIAWNYVIMVVPEVLADLDRGLADWGPLWSAIALGVVATSIPAGALGDRFGARAALGLGLALAGATLLLRAQAHSFAAMYLEMLGFGVALALVLSNFPKAFAVWFPPSELGLANGLAQAGVGAGVGLAALLTPTLVGPLGGWRELTTLLGYACLALGAVWVATVRDPARRGDAGRGILRGILQVLRVRDARLVALCYFLYVAGYLGALGYLPTYLTERGLDSRVVSVGPWSFIVGSLLLPLLSDRIGLRRIVYLPGMLAGGLALLAAAYASGPLLVLAIVALGFGTGVVGLLFVIPAEMEGVGPGLAGSAVGVATTAGFVGGWLSPLVGLPLAATSPILAFWLFAACFAGSSLLVLTLAETGPRGSRS